MLLENPCQALRMMSNLSGVLWERLQRVKKGSAENHLMPLRKLLQPLSGSRGVLSVFEVRMHFTAFWSLWYRSKKLSVPASVVSRIMGRGGCNITAIQDVTGAHIDVDKQKDKNGERMITIRYSISKWKPTVSFIEKFVCFVRQGLFNFFVLE